MAMITLQDLGIDRLDAEQRLNLLEQLWESLSADDVAFPESHGPELDARLEAADADPSQWRPWHEVRARLRDDAV